jgi:hypothetical protein
MQGSTNVRQTPGRRAGRGSSVLLLAVLLAVFSMLLLSLFAILEGGKSAQAIVGGDKVTDPATYPFMAQLVYTNPDTKKQTVVCTGTLIGKDSVLTAGHCLHQPDWKGGNPNPEAGQLYDPKDLSVIIGSTKAKDTSKGELRKLVATDKQSLGKSLCCGSEEYKGPGTGPYDAAVLNLSLPVLNIYPIQLAKPDQKDSLEQPNSDKATAAGWGYTLDPKDCDGANETPSDPPKPKCEPDQLQKVELPIKEPSWWDTFHKEIWIKAGGEKGKGPCNVDSGGPLFTGPDKNGRYTQIGIASGMRGECGGNNGALYTEVNNPTIYNFITKAAGLGSANQGGGGNQGGGNQGGGNQGGGNQGGGNQGGGTTGGSGSSTGTDTTGADTTGTDTTGTDTTTGSGSTTGGDTTSADTTGGSGSSTGADTTGSGTTDPGSSTGADTTSGSGSSTGADTTGSGSSTSGGTTGGIG